MKTRRLVSIGLLFLGTIFILFWGLNFLKGRNFLQTEKDYFATYDRIGGLMVSSPVTLKGFKVGEVREIRLREGHYDQVIVRFSINYPGLELPVATVPKIYSMDLMGTKGVQLLLSDSLSNYAYGDTLLGAIEGDLKDQVNAQMLPLKRKAEDLMGSMDSVLIALHLVFDQENRSNLSQSFEIVAQTLRNFEQTSVFVDTFVKSESNKFSYILTNLDSLSASLVRRTEEIRGTLSNLDQFTDSLNNIPIKDAIKQFNHVLGEVSGLIHLVNQGEGSLGKLVMDDSLYNSINEVSYSLNALLEDVKQNPKRYVRLSALDRGKTIIASDNSELLAALSGDLHLEYYVCLVSSEVPLKANDPLLKNFKQMESTQVGKTFYYYILRTGKYDRARRLLAKQVESYPQAGLYAWINGVWQRITF